MPPSAHSDRPAPDALFFRFERHGPTVLIKVLITVPSMIAAPIDEASGGHDLTSLRFATSPSEALPVSLSER